MQLKKICRIPEGKQSFITEIILFGYENNISLNKMNL